MTASGGVVCGAFVLATRTSDTDFTAGDLKQAMALVAVAAAALHNSRLFEEVVEVKNYNESVLENLSNGVITLDLSRHIAKTNAAALRILRREGASLVGLPFSAVFSDDNDWLVDCVNEVMDGGHVEVIDPFFVVDPIEVERSVYAQLSVEF